MKVLIIGSDRLLFDEGSAVYSRMTEYASRTEEMHVVVFSTGDNLREKSSGNLFLHPTNSSSRWSYVFDAYSLGKQIVRSAGFIRGASVISAQDPFESGLVALWISRSFRLPLHIQVHTDFFSPRFASGFLNRLRLIIARYVLPKAASVRVVSQSLREKISGRYPALQVEVLPVFVDVRAFENTLVTRDLRMEFQRYRFIILMVSRLAKEKRIDIALRALEKLLQKYPYAGLVIAGDGPERDSLEVLSRSLGIFPNVSFIGWQSDPATLYKTAHTFLSTSDYEGYGLTLIEAGAAGCPIVATNVGIAEEICVDGQNALLCRPGDVEGIAEALHRMISDEGERERRKQKMQADLLAHFLPREEYATRYIGMLEKLVPFSNSIRRS